MHPQCGRFLCDIDGVRNHLEILECYKRCKTNINILRGLAPISLVCPSIASIARRPLIRVWIGLHEALYRHERPALLWIWGLWIVCRHLERL